MEDISVIYMLIYVTRVFTHSLNADSIWYMVKTY